MLLNTKNKNKINFSEERFKIEENMKNEVSVLKNKSLLATTIITCVTGLAGLLGMIIHGAYTYTGGPTWIRNQYIGLWLTTLLLFFSLQSLYSTFKNPTNIRHQKTFTIELIYASTCILLCFIMTICYGLANKADATIWSLILLAVNLIINYIIITRFKTSTVATEKNKKNCILKALPVLNWILKCLFLLFLCLLTSGSIQIGGLTLKYPPRGKFISVKLADSTERSLSIHYLCDGPINSSFPVYMFEGSGSHGLMDYYGLQTVLKEQGKRSCIWDNAGLGYSDYLYTDMYNTKLYYHNFFSSIGEKPPFIFVGWGGGGATVFNYAAQHPEMVYSITFLDVSPPRVEWLTPKVLKNWTQEEYDKNVSNDMSGRYTIFGIINGLGVPWGLMSIFVSKSKAYPNSTQDEVSWYFLTDKTWTTQKQYLKMLPNQTDEYNKTSLSANITVYHIMTVKSDSQIIKQICDPRKYNASSSECQYEIQANALSIKWRQNLYKFDSIVNCSMDDCNLGYYVSDSPQFTVNSLMNLYSNASI
jgi:pimeloyl-ACP methyl ester carboxylesterase